MDAAILIRRYQKQFFTLHRDKKKHSNISSSISDPTWRLGLSQDEGLCTIFFPDPVAECCKITSRENNENDAVIKDEGRDEQ